MWRFVLPALAVMTALLVLFAGAFGDLQSWPVLANGANTVIAAVIPDTAKPPPPAPAPQAAPPVTAAPSPPIVDPQEQAARKALQLQVTALQQQADALQNQINQRKQELQKRGDELDQRSQQLAQQTKQINDQSQQIVRETQQLDSLRANSAELRQDVSSLQQQQSGEQAELERHKALAQQATAAARTAQQAAQRVKPEKRQVAAAAPSPPLPHPSPPSGPPANEPVMQPMLTPSASQQLLTARQWLAGGHPAEARQILAIVQTQMVFQPVTPDQPVAQGSNSSATEVGEAIRWLDRGADGQAMEAINRAIGSVNASRSQSDTVRVPISGQLSAPPGYYSGYSER